MRLLFVCSRNRLRSPTAEAVFSTYPGLEAISAGTSNDAENPISSELITWADIIFVMEGVHRRRLNDRFKSSLKGKKLVVLGIPDKYEYLDTDLVKELKAKVHPFIKL